jgi:hypothetical protein
VTAMPGSTRGTPIAMGMLGMAEQKATGMPARSISLAIVDPQRLQVPQVAVRMAAWMPASLNS